MNQIYIANTPYHLLLSCGLAAISGSSDKKYLIIIPAYSDSDIFYRSLTEWDKNPFYKIIIAKSIVNVPGKIQPLRILRNNVKIIKTFFLDNINEACDVFVFNDRYPEAQILARLNHDKGGFNTYVEDGSAAYNRSVASNMPACRKFICKLALGMWFTDNSIIGTYKYIDKIMVNQPELVRLELSSKKLIKIPKNIFKDLKSFIYILFRNYSIEQTDLNAKSILIISHSDAVSRDLIEIYKYLIEHLSSRSNRVYVKYHPREDDDDFLGVKSYSPQINIIPKTLPLEAVFIVLQGEDEPGIIVGDLSTSLLTAKYLFNTTIVISIVKLSSLTDINLEYIFEKIGVSMPKNFEDLKSLMNSNNSD